MEIVDLFPEMFLSFYIENYNLAMPLIIEHSARTMRGKQGAKIVIKEKMLHKKMNIYMFIKETHESQKCIFPVTETPFLKSIVVWWPLIDLISETSVL